VFERVCEQVVERLLQAPGVPQDPDVPGTPVDVEARTVRRGKERPRPGAPQDQTAEIHLIPDGDQGRITPANGIGVSDAERGAFE
jgi:hypothetical protein